MLLTAYHTDKDAQTVLICLLFQVVNELKHLE